ncbi:Ribosomal-protein-serine acetyltransferase [Pantoea sp. AS-PWVM4]|uniref:GNAT family N-acetyltransferase n=1 Tax=Pantoea sp. AS-PWVM4 TaxID=1332069 RepID=UPI0003AC8EFD|nr:GNAT family protein [Pantoea sp. AS-PWVM4]ERK08090.1 Ribosomal-protein-serine acetyltransferase [Pantoea sp. AS-PWVM4]
MSQNTNAWGQPVGFALPDWQPRPRPEFIPFTGDYCFLEPLSAERHGRELYAAYALAEDGRDWTYMFAQPFKDEAAYLAYARQIENGQDPMHFAVIDKESRRAVGTLALMRIEPTHGVMEIGHVAFSPLLKQTRMATEAHYLLMRYAFEQFGYRRYEWKCDSCNQPSRNAALRLGFQLEGIFRQAIVYKGRSRDTCWFSIIDSEWPQVKLGFERWLSADNFDAGGRQRNRLEALRQG